MKYAQHKGKQLAKKVREQIKYEQEFKKEVKEFSIINFLYGKDGNDLRKLRV